MPHMKGVITISPSSQEKCPQRRAPNASKTVMKMSSKIAKTDIKELPVNLYL